jgi:hypothetical protein
MEFFEDLFFGKREERSFSDERLGELSATVRRGRDRAWCLWRGQHWLEGQRGPTRFCLSGDGEGPYRDLLANVHRILDDLPRIADKANIALHERAAEGSFNDFHLFAVGDWEPHDGVLELELVPFDKSVLTSDLTIYWPEDGERENHHIVLRRARIANKPFIWT